MLAEIPGVEYDSDSAGTLKEIKGVGTWAGFGR